MGGGGEAAAPFDSRSRHRPFEPPPYRPSWVLHLQPGGAVLVERHSQFYVRLTTEATEMALLLSRTGDLTRVGAVLAALGRRDGEGIAGLSRRLEANPFTAAWPKGLLGDDIRISGSSVAYLPVTCSLQLTNGCNLRCGFCYASSGTRYPQELGPPDWLGVIERLAAAGVCSVTLTGGEPTMAAGFREILAAAGAYFVNVDVFTNGLHWTDDARRLAAALGNVRCQVSIDGRRAHHDDIRGRVGSYDSAMRTVRYLGDAGVPVSVAMTVTPESADDVGPLVDEVAAAGAVMFRAGRVQDVGRGDDEGFSLSPAEEDVVVVALREAAARWPGVHVVRWDVCETDADKVAAATGTTAEFMTPGYLHWHVRADGWVTPCQIEEVPIGHILRDSIDDIGRPERIDEVKAVAKGCRCIRRVRLPATMAPAFLRDWPAGRSSDALAPA